VFVGECWLWLKYCWTRFTAYTVLDLVSSLYTPETTSLYRGVAPDYGDSHTTFQSEVQFEKQYRDGTFFPYLCFHSQYQNLACHTACMFWAFRAPSVLFFLAYFAEDWERSVFYYKGRILSLASPSGHRGVPIGVHGLYVTHPHMHARNCDP
jgi:hypothetical protein